MLVLLAAKFHKLKEIISGFHQVTVAFSGGVDSTLLLYTARQVLGANAAAFFANSAVQSAAELQNCLKIAQFINLDLAVFELDLLDDSDFYNNSADRCFYCKNKVYKLFLTAMKDRDGGVLLDGTNLDDNDNQRPGSRAIKELGVKTPLRLAGFHKNDIRQLSRELGLPNWDRPSASCLATRVPFGQLITARKLKIISQAEDLLKSHSILGCRVRLYDSHAVVELVEANFCKFIEKGIYSKLCEFLKTEGIQEVFLDLSAREGILF